MFSHKPLKVQQFDLSRSLIFCIVIFPLASLNAGQDVESWRDSVDYLGGPRKGSVKRRRLNYMGDVHMY